ncbi:MAG: 30S ribosomal protein S5 [bacterium]
MRDNFSRDNRGIDQEPPEFEEKVIQIDRVTRVVKGGRRMRFRATVVVGNKKGKVGVGVEKGNEVMTAVQKATNRAKSNIVTINLNGTTILHEVSARLAGAYVFLKPASEGTGVIAGGAVRAVLEAAGVKDILSKMIGSNSKINNAYATVAALESLKKAPEVTAVVEKKTTKKVEVETAEVKKPEAKKTKKELVEEAK